MDRPMKLLHTPPKPLHIIEDLMIDCGKLEKRQKPHSSSLVSDLLKV